MGKIEICHDACVSTHIATSLLLVFVFLTVAIEFFYLAVKTYLMTSTYIL